MKLLLVDDDAFLRDMYALKFTECGHTVDAVDTGTLALSRLQNSLDFEAVVLDMVMPGMSGVDLIKEIKQRFPTFKAILIVLSNQGQPEDVEEAMEAGAHGYIIKAESVPSEVVRKVEAIVKSKA